MTEVIKEKSTLQATKLTQSAKNTTEPSLFDWTHNFILSESDINAIAEPEWIIKNLVISGHVILVPAEPNAGKTTIFFYLASKMSQQGYDVCYVNTDISGGDAKPLAILAKEKEFKLLLPDMKVGLSMNDVLHRLIEISKSSKDLTGNVFIFDTLKKMLNVLNKSAAKRFFQLIRSLSAKGMTIILLAHTNKYTDNDGNPIYEGTGDMRSDVDELIYLIPQKHDDGSMTVTTKPDKVRGAFEPITFNITPERIVTQADEFVDVFKETAMQQQLKDDKLIIDTILDTINDGLVSQKAIIDACKDVDIGERTVKKVLKIYGDSNTTNDLPKYWIKTKGDKNSFIYEVI